MVMNSFHVYRLLSESQIGECPAPVLGRKGICRYIDEQNWRGVPPVWIEAEWET